MIQEEPQKIPMKRKILRILEALKLKRLSLRISFLVKNLNKKIVKGTRSILIPLIINKRQKGGILAVDLCNRQGLGAKLEWSLPNNTSEQAI